MHLESYSLFAEMHLLQPNSRERKSLRERIVVMHLPLAQRLARRHWSPIEPLEDMEQVAAIGLVKAVDDYDPKRAVPFQGYAVPKILGELWRYLRDYPGAIRIPRSVQEIQTTLRQAIGSDAAGGRGDRSADQKSLSARLGVPESVIVECLRADRIRYPRSLDMPVTEFGLSLRDILGTEDDEIEAVELRQDLHKLLNALPLQERHVIRLVVMLELSQRQAAEIIGISQMQVSRLRMRALDKLRRSAVGSDPLPRRDCLRHPAGWD